jgi:hypothetical protein
VGALSAWGGVAANADVAGVGEFEPSQPARWLDGSAVVARPRRPERASGCGDGVDREDGGDGEESHGSEPLHGSA